MRVPKDSRLPLSGGPIIPLKLLLALVAGLGLLTFERREATTLHRTPVSLVVEPLKTTLSAPLSALRDARDWLILKEDLIEENRRLREEALLLQGRQLRFEALEQENMRLRGLLDSTFKVGDQVLIAEPLFIHIAKSENLFVVNKGKRHGVRLGQAVVDGKGLVGQVLRVAGRTADIILITDPSHATPVQVNRTGLRTLAVGTGRTDELGLPYLPGKADLEPGDLLVTSGLDGIFPEGYPVARLEARPEGGIQAIPVARLDHNREVLIVRTDATPQLRLPEPVLGLSPPEGHGP